MDINWLPLIRNGDQNQREGGRLELFLWDFRVLFLYNFRRDKMLIIEKQLKDVLEKSIKHIYQNKELKAVEITIATNEKFGDYQSNFAMMNSKLIGDNPRMIAQKYLIILFQMIL